MMMRGTPAGLLCVMLALGAAPAAHADLSDRQSDAAREQQALRGRISVLQKTLDEREAVRQEAADALKASESAISQINRRLAELDQDNRAARTDLAGLTAQIGRQQTVLAQRRAELADQLRAQYTSGLSPWTALLSGDDPQQLGRNLGYLDYVSQARALAIRAIHDEIARLAELQRRADDRSDALRKILAETAERKTALQGQQKERASVLARLEGQIAAQRNEAARLGRDDERLTRLIDDLDAAIVQQVEAARQAERARQQAEQIARRQAKEAAERAEQARRDAEQTRREAEKARVAAQAQRSEQATRQAREADAAAHDAAAVREQAEASLRRLTPVPAVEPGITAAPGAVTNTVARATLAEPQINLPLANGKGLRRGLIPPVRGEVQGRFGVGRPDGGQWRGIVLRAPEGTPVKAVSAGTVVYAQWLRGFGNLMILDHGGQFMTVYAYNQSLLKRVGDTVQAGEPIALVGATGGQVESGLYFEIRHNGAPVDPAQWLAL